MKLIQGLVGPFQIFILDQQKLTAFWIPWISSMLIRSHNGFGREIEIENIRAAWQWALENFRPELLSQGIRGLCRFFGKRYWYNEGEATCRTLVDRLDRVHELDQSWQEVDAYGNNNRTDLKNLLAMAGGHQL